MAKGFLLYFTFIFLITFTCFSKSDNNYKSINLRGLVVDENNQTLPGVTISLNNGEMGAVSDMDGFFVIENLRPSSHQLMASFVGYESFVTTINASSDELDLKIELKHANLHLGEVMVRANHARHTRRTESVAIEMIQENFLRVNRSGSLMQTLSRLPGVNSMDVGSGISKPMIRGLGHYRVVVAQNGIKHEGQQWSSHTGLSLDQQNMEQIEVIKGPASLQYGSDAMGGVINILPRSIPSQGISGEVNLIGKSNTRWFGGAGRVSGRRGDFYMHGSFTHNNYGDFRVPGTEEFLLPAPVSAMEASHTVALGQHVLNTAGRENALGLVSGIIRPWGNSYFDFNYHHSKVGFFDWVGLNHENKREEHKTNLRDILVPYQIVNNYSVSHFTNAYINNNKLELALGYQYNESSEHCHLSDRTGNRYADLLHYQNLDDLELLLQLHNLSANAKYSYRNVNRHRFDFIINSQMHLHAKDGYAHILPEYQRLSLGGGLIHRFDISDQWILNTGARMDVHDFSMKEALNPDPQFGDPVFNRDFDKIYTGSSFSLGINYLPTANTTFKTHLGKSYRVPSAYELGAYGLHRHEGRFEKGDINLSPEEAWQIDVGMETSGDFLKLSLNPFANYFTNYLYLNPSSELRPEGQVYEYRQTVALLTGGEAALEFRFTDNIHLDFTAEYVYAVNMDLLTALPFTPPMKSITELKYEFSNHNALENSFLGIEMEYVAAQNFTVPNELSTPAYTLFNLNAATEIKFFNQNIHLMVRVNNIFDTKHFNHLSFYRRLRIPEAGRDFQLFVTVPF